MANLKKLNAIGGENKMKIQLQFFENITFLAAIADLYMKMSVGWLAGWLVGPLFRQQRVSKL